MQAWIMARCQGVLMYYHKKQTSSLSAQVLFVAQSWTCTVCLSCSHPWSSLPQATSCNIYKSHRAKWMIFWMLPHFWAHTSPWQWETLVLQQDLSNTPLAPAILQLCLCQMDLTCAQNWAGINRQSPGPQSRERAKATIFPHSKLLQLELWWN